MKRIFILLMAISGLLNFVSCAKNSIPSTAEEHFSKQGLMPNFDNLLFEHGVAYLGGLHDNDEPWMRARSGENLLYSPDNAKVIIIGNSLVNSMKDTLKKAYGEGKFIIVGNADIDSLKAYRERFGWQFTIPSRQPKGRFAYGIAKNHAFLLSSPFHKNENGEIIVDDGVSPFQAMRGMMSFIDGYFKEKKQTKSSVTAGKLDIPDQIYSENFSWYEDVTYQFSPKYTAFYYRLFREFAIQYSVFSCYAPEDGSEQFHGDYYSVKAVCTNYPPTMYERASSTAKDPIDGKAAHFMWGEESKRDPGVMKIKGPWNSQMKMVFRAEQAEDLVFCIEGHPSPESDIQVKDYTTVKTKSWEVGLSGGYENTGGKSGGNVSLSLGVGGSTENWVAYSMSDIGVKNYSDNNRASFEFNYQNIPDGKSTSYKDWDNASITTISTSRADFESAWIWQSSSSGKKKDYDSAPIPFIGEFTQTVDVYCEDRYDGSWSAQLMKNPYTWTDLNFQLEVARIPVGCLRIDNKCQTNQILFNIKVQDQTTREYVYEAKSAISRDEHLEVLLPQKDRNYSVSFDMGQSSSYTVPYYSYDSKITLPLLVNADTDKKILSVVEGGGEFTTKSGYLRVINQSATNLVRNLKVCNAAGTVVYQYPNSLGYNNQADIYLTAGTSYYVTMEYGSASNFSLYKSENNFELPLYSNENNIKILIAADPDGGDFVKQ